MANEEEKPCIFCGLAVIINRAMRKISHEVPECEAFRAVVMAHNPDKTFVEIRPSKAVPNCPVCGNQRIENQACQRCGLSIFTSLRN